MNSKAAQLTEDGTEIVRLFARFALGVSFLSAVADRFGLWGPHGAKNVAWGDFAHFAEYTGAVTSLFPSSLKVSFAWAGTVAETLLGILLIAGFKVRMSSVLSGLLLLSFAMTAWPQVLASRRHSTIRSSRRPLQHSYSRSGSLTDSRWTSFWVDHETEREIQVKTQTRRRMWHGVVDSRRWLDNPFDVPERPSRLFHSRFREAAYIRLTTDRRGPRARMQGCPTPTSLSYI